jgi:hypothetical protein
MWTSQNRARYDGSKLRYPSDLTDDEWGLVEPLIPPGQDWRWQAYGDHAGGGETMKHTVIKEKCAIIIEEVE